MSLNVDIPNETIFFTGSDAGVPAGAGPYFTLRWEYGSGTGNLGQAALVATSGFDFSLSPYAGTFATNTGAISLSLVFRDTTSNPGTISVTGNSTALSYAAWPASNKALLESLTSGDVLAVTRGTGISPVQVNVIPETGIVDTTTTLTCATPVALGASTTCTAIVTRSAGNETPSGSLDWAGNDTAATFGNQTCNRDTAAGTLTCTIRYTPSAVGTVQVWAVFPGDSNFKASRGDTSVTVDRPPSTFSVSATVAGGTGTVSCAPSLVKSGGKSQCTAVPGPGDQVDAWSGDCAGSGSSAQCSLTNIQANRSSSVVLQAGLLLPAYRNRILSDQWVWCQQHGLAGNRLTDQHAVKRVLVKGGQSA